MFIRRESVSLARGQELCNTGAFDECELKANKVARGTILRELCRGAAARDGFVRGSADSEAKVA